VNFFKLFKRNLIYKFKTKINIDKDHFQKNTDLESQFFSLNVEKIESVVVDNNIIKIGVKFISEQFKNNDENTIIKKQDVWTFEKHKESKSPIWTLVAT